MSVEKAKIFLNFWNNQVYNDYKVVSHNAKA